MKTYNKLLTIALTGMIAVGCNDLDTYPLGDHITTDQKNEVLANNPDMAEAGVNGIATLFTVYGNASGNPDAHYDIGYPGVMLNTDSRGADMVSLAIGYNWYSQGTRWTDVSPTSGMTELIWNTMYNQIFACNNVLSSIPADTEDPTLLYYRAQALAFRAFDYHVLAQYYQFTYLGNEDALCVPVITEENSNEAAASGLKCSTVAEVYTKILEDLDGAITALNATGNTAVKQKKFLSEASARGLRARVYMCMGKWNEAAADADFAIKNSGCSPYSVAEVSRPTFWDCNDHAWLWAIDVQESDRVVTTGICNWPSHMGTFTYGYAQVGSWRKISKALYAEIPDTDVRKGWFLNEEGTSPNLSEEYQEYVNQVISEDVGRAYVQVKFAPYQDILENPTNANDIPLLRAEELYFILAEAQAMGGNPAAGAATLGDFVRAYRDPSYVNPTGTAEDIRDAVYWQRRVELWGEGVSYFDMMRLKKGVDRRGAGFEPSLVFNVAPTDKVLLYHIPQAEFNGNKILGVENEPMTSPKPVADY